MWVLWVREDCGGTTDVLVLQMIGMFEVGRLIEIKCNQLLGSLEGTFVQSFEISLIVNKVGKWDCNMKGRKKSSSYYLFSKNLTF